MEVGGREQRVGGGGDVYFQLHSCAISLGAEILEKTAGGGEWGGGPKRKIAESLQGNVLRKRREVILLSPEPRFCFCCSRF